jgi:hypothetical protein
MANRSKYGYIYFIYLSKYKGDSVYPSLKPGLTDKFDIDERLNQHRIEHKCEPIVFLVIKTKSTSYYEGLIIDKIFNRNFSKIGKTREYFLYNETINLQLINNISNKIKKICGVDKQQYNINENTCIYIDYFRNIDLRYLTYDNYYDIENIIEKNDWSIPMELV